MDWRSEQDRQRFKEFEQANDVNIQTYALLSGTVQVEGAPDLTMLPSTEETAGTSDCNTINLSSLATPLPKLAYISSDALGVHNKVPYSPLTGRFGITSSSNEQVEDYCKRVGTHLQKFRKGENTLCLGTGEFMHIPMKTAVYMGGGVSYHSATRSPIFPINREDYPIRSRFSFESPEDPSIMNYVYNIADTEYDEVFLFFERHIDTSRLEPMLRQFSSIPLIHVIFFN